MAAIWDPRTVLNIHPGRQDFTCSGTTKKGSRCKQSMISRADLSTASQILEDMALLRPKSRTVCERLPDVAYLTLCPRWHRKPGYCQVTEVVQKWQMLITIYCNSITSRGSTTPLQTSRGRAARSTSEDIRITRAPPQSTSTIVEPTRAASASYRSTYPPRRPTVSSTPPASLERSRAQPVTESPRTTTSDPSSDLPTPPTTPVRRFSAAAAATTPSNATSPRSNSQSTTDAPSMSEATTPPPSMSEATTPLLSTSEPNTPPPSTSEPTTPAPSISPSTPCPSPRHTVTRKPITAACCICYEPICCPDDAVWCRAQCGQNIHRECFGQWRKHSFSAAAESRMAYDAEERLLEAMLRAVKCVFCRSPWMWEWQD